MKRIAEDHTVVAHAPKRVRTASDDVDSAYVSAGTTSTATTLSPLGLDHDILEASVTSTTSRKRPKNLPCSYEGCDKVFDRPARLEIHVRSHTQERPFVCGEPGCDKAFFRLEHLKAHTKAKHDDQRDHVCTYQLGFGEDGKPLICDKSFHTATKLRRHIAAHEEKEQTKCEECGQIFRKQETLQRHIKSVHLGEDAFRCAHVPAGELDAEECGRTFATVGLLKAHVVREHSGVRFFCEQCHSTQGDAMDEHDRSIGFITYAELQLHMKTVHPPTCGLCGFVANSNKGLKAHADIMHQTLSDRQRFPCSHPSCTRSFTKKGNLKVHMQSVHAQVKAYTCGETDLSNSKKVQGWSGLGCGSGFASKAGLEQHVRTQHLGHSADEVYSYQLKHKDASVPKKTQATSELTGFAYEEDRPVPCLVEGCESRFRKDHDLVIHLELHHSWNIDDINDALAEAAALQGDKFWIGGFDETDEPLQRHVFHNIAEAVDVTSRSLPPFEPMDLDPQLQS
ncbi:hypothetical protein AMS68_003081 [Peltaster fructicola]|uniref:C2H2-type domain-containing protein n=1 Tax=Peltaster fructicola TaxID=286661 RepID=A0A6H0XS51_9PEZI|nr:hypothetical protein AMS68_003081 [Peltaster fructicola]